MQDVREIGARNRIMDILLDRYRIRNRFEGGMGILWTVWDADTGRPYAIKTIRTGREGLAERFRTEARTWIALGSHQNIVQAFWLVERDETPYLVLEYVDGGNLADRMGGGRLALGPALDLAMQLARGMAYAHSRPVEGGVGVVHRDLKPQNLLLTRAGVLKIGDFGLARVFREPSRDHHPEEGVGVGTPAYTAPEQLRGERAADGRADIHSFGVVVYEMLAGTNPLAAADWREQIRRTMEFDPPPLQGVPAALAALVARCMAKRPGDRPGDFTEVLGHLAQVARGLEGQAFVVDPAFIEPPRALAGLVVEAVVLRPRQPRAGLPFSAEVVARGDFGPGPVELAWRPLVPAGMRILTPGGAARARLAAGGSGEATLRVHLIAEERASYPVAEGRLLVRGPESTGDYAVPGFVVEPVDAFLPPLLERDEELSMVRAALDGSGASVLFFGEIGAGKTRLLVEAGRLGVEAGRRVVAASARVESLRPMGILADLARRILRLPREDSSRVRAAVSDLVGDDRPTAGYFTDLLLGGTADGMETPLVHRWFVLLEAAAEEEPLLLLLDDLQFADKMAARVVVDLAARIRDAGLAVSLVATCGVRPEHATARHRAELLRRHAATRRIESRTLLPLSRGAIAGLLDRVFAGHTFAEEAGWLERVISRTTRGNPAHVAEILHLLRGHVTRVGREWRLDPGVTPASIREFVPAALHDAVHRRLEALGPDAREVTEVAALVGEEFDVALLKAILDPGRVDRALREMEGAEVIRPTDSDADRYRFWSAAVPPLLKRELEKEDPERGRRLHREVAEAMLKLYRSARRLRNALSIARHLRAGGLGVRSVAYTLAGCERLLSLQLPDRARRLLANAEPLVVDDPAVTAEQRQRFWYLYGLACEATGEYEEGSDALSRFIESGRSLPGRPRSLARAHARLGRIHRARGEFDDAQYSLGAARELLEEIGDRRALAFVFVSLAELAVDRGRLLKAQELLRRAGELAGATGNEGAAIRAAILDGRVALELDDPRRAQGAFEGARQRAAALGDRERLAAALKGLGLVALELGYLDQAKGRLMEAFRQHARRGDRAALGSVLVHLGSVHAAAGDLERAAGVLRRAKRMFTDIGHPEGVAAARMRLGALLRGAARTTDAVGELAAAAESYARLRLPDRVGALHELGLALVDAGSGRPARIALARADRAAPPGGARKVQRVLSRAARARLALREGNGDLARGLARRALATASRTSGHAARLAAQRVAAEVALCGGDLDGAQRAAETVAAFAREEGDLLAAADSERILAEVAARAGRLETARSHARRAFTAYRGRGGGGAGPARVLAALAQASERYRRAARRCRNRLEAQGFRAHDCD